MPKEKVNILLVEDDPSQEQLIRIAFQNNVQTDFDLITATSVHTAKSILDNIIPDLVISDLMLPDGTGREFLPGEGNEAQFPVIIMTCHGDENIAVECMKLGAMDYVVKSPSVFYSMPRISENVIRNWKLQVERDKALEKEKQVHELLRAIWDVNHIIAREKSIHSLMKKTAEVLQSRRGYYNVWFLLVDDLHTLDSSNPEMLSMQSCGGNCINIAGREKTCIKEIYRHSGLLVITDERTDRPFCPASARNRGDREFAVKLSHGNNLYGSMFVSLSIRQEFVNEEFAMLTELASDISMAITAIENEFIKQQAVAELIKFKTISDSANYGSLILNEQLRIDYANSAIISLFGVKYQDVIGQPLCKFFASSDTNRCSPLKNIISASCEKVTDEFWFSRADGSKFPALVSIKENYDPQSNQTFYSVTVIDITELKKAEFEHNRLAQIVRQVGDIIFTLNSDGYITYVNDAFENDLGYSSEDITSKPFSEICDNLNKSDGGLNLDSLLIGGEWTGKLELKKKNGSVIKTDISIWKLDGIYGQDNFVAIARDITTKLEMESELRHSQKLQSIGQLAAGIAHEINTPMQFIGDNTRFLKDSFEEFITLIAKENELISSAGSLSDSESLSVSLKKAIEEADIEFLADEIPKAIEQSMDGIRRVSEIVRAMKEFSHPGTEEKSAVDINKAIQSTITVARNEWKYVADLETDFDPMLPLVQCYPGEFNQVILNLITNAAQAIGDKHDPNIVKGKILVSTNYDGEYAEIRISDTGSGIPENIRDRIFEPFFTTKDVGKGTGQGLAIAHSVITDKHNGTITFRSEIGKGTTFIIRIPVSSQSSGGEHRETASLAVMPDKKETNQ